MHYRACTRNIRSSIVSPACRYWKASQSSARCRWMRGLDRGVPGLVKGAISRLREPEAPGVWGANSERILLKHTAACRLLRWA
jgi:hypothetical protein